MPWLSSRAMTTLASMSEEVVKTTMGVIVDLVIFDY
jgi:hypothetical protein